MRKKGNFEMLHLGHVSHMHWRACNSRLSAAGITPAMPFMLAYLKDHAGCIPRDIARRWNLDPATITSVLSTMESEGLVERKAVPGDKRALQVFLTAKGEEKAALVYSIHDEYERLSFQGFTKEERELFEQMLDRIEQNLKTEKKERDDGQQTV